MSNLNPEVLVSIDGSYALYYSLFGAYNKWVVNSPNKRCIENVDKKNLPKLTQFEDFVNLYEDQIVKRFETIYWIINTRIFKGIKFTSTPKVFLCLDSPLKDNWRMCLYKEYKQQRKVAEQKFDVREAFSYGMNLILNKINVEQYFGIKIIKVLGAEGDDIIATINTKIEAPYKFIIASDKDFLQLAGDIRMFDMCGKEVKPPPYKDMAITGRQYLLSKILTGDKSDNIPQVFNRCGTGMAMKLVLNVEELKNRLKNDPIALEQFKLNSKLIDFKNIPETLTESILEEINSKFEDNKSDLDLI